MANAKRDDNNVTTVLWVSKDDSSITIPVKVNPVTWRVLIETPWWGAWDVVWPASAVDENIAVFDDVTGKLIKDWGKKISDLSLVVDWEQIYYVWKNGNDSNDWLTTDKAFLTFWAAITAASAQTPSVSNRFTLYCNDAWLYTESITVPEYITIKATNASVDWNITVTDNQSVRICTINKLIRTTWTWSVFVDACRIKTPDTETGVLNSSAWMLILKSRIVDAPLNWIGINNTWTWHIHCEINHLSLEWDNAIWIQSDWWGIVGSIEVIIEDWTPTSTTALKVVDWHIDINSSDITADTAYNVAANKILTLSVWDLTWTKTVAAWWDAQISEASKSTDDLAATWLVNWTWVVTINADTTKINITGWVSYTQGTRDVYAWWTAITPTIAGGDSSTWVWLSSGTIVYSATVFTTLQTRTILPLARLQAVQWESWPWSNLQSPIDLRFVISESWYLQRDYQEKAIWVLYHTWGTYLESSTALQVNQSAWLFYDPQRKPLDITSDTDISASAAYHISWSWALQTEATLITPLYYDNWTDIVTLSVNKWASHTLLRTQKEDDNFVLVYSPAVYDSEAEAEAAWIYYWLFIWQASWLTAVASIIIKGSSTNIDSIVDRRPFVWGNNPWVVGTASRQQVRDNSSNPETVTDSTRWAETWKRGSAADTDDVLEVLNGSDVQTFAVTWEWKIDATELTLDTALAIAEWGTWSTSAWDARTALDVDQAWTDNSTDVTLAWTPNYITIAWQVITRALINLTSHITGILPIANWGTNSSTESWARTNLWVAIWSDVQAYDADNATNDSTTTFTNKTFDANGTWNSISNIDVADLADWTDWELITWASDWTSDTVAVWTVDQVLTSNWVWEAPTFQDAGWGWGISEIFDVKLSGTYNLTTSEWIVTFNTENIDTWSNFNTSTYKYTAPSDWNYFFYLNSSTLWFTAWDNIYLKLFVNSVNVATIHNSNSWTEFDAQINKILSLSSWDTVDIRAVNNTATRWGISSWDFTSFGWYKL